MRFFTILKGVIMFAITSICWTTGAQTIANPYIDVQGPAYTREHIYTLNKAGSGWLAWAFRNTSGSDARIDLSHIRTISASDFIGIGLTNPDFGLSINSVEDQTLLGRNKKSVVRIMNGYGDAFGRRSEIQFALSQLPNEALAVIAAEYSAWNGGVGGDLLFGTTSTNSNTMFERMRINTLGNVGIGTTNPNQKLTVNGTIYGKEVKVDLNVPGPDYVFEEDYQLPSLTETEAYIKTNKHLPEVPSAKEMEANGINLSEMNILLLKKVEELTLHLIELSKDNRYMKEEIKQLKDKK